MIRVSLNLAAHKNIDESSDKSSSRLVPNAQEAVHGILNEGAIQSITYGYSMSSNRGFIDKLPDELLQEILLWHNAKRRVTRNVKLMLVCKRWKHLVTSTRRLWSRVELIVGETIISLEKCCRLLEICFTASGNAPLDLTLDLTGVADLHLISGLELFAPNADRRKYGLDGLTGLDFEDAAKTLYQRLVFDLVKSLTAETLEFKTSRLETDGEVVVTYVSHMQRWRYFHLKFGDDISMGEVEQTFSIFRYPAPLLETLELGFPFELTMYGAMNLTLPEKSFPSLRNLTVLTTNAAIDLFQFHQRGAQSLQTLSFDVTPASLLFLSKFSHLLTLTLHIGVDSRGHRQQFSAETKISLPRLNSLVIQDDLRAVNLLHMISAPSLHHLQLGDVHIPYRQGSLPLLNGVRVFEWAAYFGDEDEDEMRRELTFLLSQCHQLVELKTWAASGRPDRSAFDPMKAMVREILEGHPSETLQIVTYLCPDGGSFEDSKISEVVRLPFPIADSV
ncbi:hypothetical protein FRC17_001368 [Serendipita sp. 399]|nr:hypothetical protein FRC17_001368 [Serendipita sp. 399]